MEVGLFNMGTIVLLFCSRIYGRALINQNIGLNQDTEVTEYLQKFGYMTKTNTNGVGTLNTDSDIAESLRTFQQWNNLPVTGVLDTETQKLMSTPRCGVPDPQTTPGMPKPFVLGPKWTKSTLTYRFLNYSPDLSSTVIRSETARAFRFWTDVANLGISETSGTSDITLFFGSGYHGDNAPFDGAGGVLAHAWFPEDGRCHFDEAETWVANSTGIDYFLVAAHEFGHILGLDHSNTQSALMYPYYSGYIPNYTIDADDRAAIIAHYGAATTTTTTTTTPTPTTTTEKPTTTISLTTTDEITTQPPTTTTMEETTEIPTTTSMYMPTTTDPTTNNVKTTKEATTTSSPTTDNMKTTTEPTTMDPFTTRYIETTTNAPTTDMEMTSELTTANVPKTTVKTATTEKIASFPETTSDVYFMTASEPLPTDISEDVSSKETTNSKAVTTISLSTVPRGETTTSSMAVINRTPTIVTVFLVTLNIIYVMNVF